VSNFTTTFNRGEITKISWLLAELPYLHNVVVMLETVEKDITGENNMVVLPLEIVMNYRTTSNFYPYQHELMIGVSDHVLLYWPVCAHCEISSM
jgi:hypothetical protein